MTSRQRIITELAYSDAYKETCFYIWYKNNRCTLDALVANIAPSEDGRIPTAHVLSLWKNRENWEQRADVLDANVSTELDIEVIEDRIQMFRKHAEIGDKMTQKGMDYLNSETGGIQSDSAAIRAIVEGIEIESSSRGIADALSKVYSMSEKQLDDELKKMLTNNAGDVDVIDAKPVDIEKDDTDEKIDVG